MRKFLMMYLTVALFTACSSAGLRNDGLRFNCASYADEPEIVAQDRGPCIPAHAREQAVRPFLRLETPVHEQGSGLALAIAAAVARPHRGYLVLENAERRLRIRLRFGVV